MEKQINIPSNIIIKSIYNNLTYSLLFPRYINEIKIKIINYLKTIEERDLKDLEIEAKLGYFFFEGNLIDSYKYINAVFVLPNFNYQNAYKYRFNAGINPNKFFLIWNTLDNESKKKNSEISGPEIRIYNEIHYQSGKRKSLIFDKDKKQIKEEVIKKDRKNPNNTINVSNLGNDFRITILREKETDINYNEDKEEIKRDKYRISYQFRYFRIDMSITYEKSNNIVREPSYEIELENNKLNEILRDKYGNIDYDNFALILDRFIQNIHNLYSAADKNIIMNKNININNKFENYFENNL